MADNAGGMAADLIRPAAEEIGKSIVMLVKRRLNYLCCFNANIQNMRNEAKKLDDAKAGMQMHVDEAEANTRIIVPEVMTWIKDTDEIQVQMKEIDTDYPKVRSGCLNIVPRYSLSKKAIETAEAMEKLRNNSSFGTISLPGPPAARLPLPPGQAFELQSRKELEESIMEALRRNTVTLLGIIGMGGLGKTTMAKRIMQRMRDEDLADEAVFVVVSQNINVLNIQGEVADQIGFKELKDVVSEKARALKLHQRLSRAKRMIIVLDDIWEKISFEDLGIPTSSTILLTSRKKELLDQMRVKVFEMKLLPEADARSLFKDKAGPCVDDETLASIAKEIVKECNGLPLAIVSAGSALRNKEKESWNDAVRRLKRPNPENVPKFLEEVYKPLRLSFDYLKDKEAELVFLFCSLYPEDFDINLKILTLYITGLNILTGVDSLEEARNAIFCIVEKLKSHSLLLDGTKKNEVKIHDVIRDVATFIASEEGLVKPHARRHTQDCKWISMFPEGNEVLHQLTGSDFPNLQLLLIHHEKVYKPLEMKDISFLGAMANLNVLSFKGISFQSLSSTLKFLKNLQTLRLEDCSMETISGVGMLLSLQILSFRGCNNIKELPAEVGRLKRLRSLELTYCFNLRHIAPGIIKQLVELEELKMLGSFDGWESTYKANKKKQGNASLNELESLSKLTCLEIGVADYSFISEELCLPSTISNYKIEIGSSMFTERKVQFNENYLDLNGSQTVSKFGNWCQQLVRISTGFGCTGSFDFRNLNLLEAHQNIKALSIRANGTMNTLVNTSTITFDQRGSNFFPLLEFLELEGLPHIKEICDGPILEDAIFFQNLGKLRVVHLPSLTHIWKWPHQNLPFANLSSIYIEECQMLQSLCSLKRGKHVFPQLNSIDIISCEMVEQVYGVEENDEDDQKTTSELAFPKLERLKLWSLSNMTVLGKGVESMEFPALKELVISFCPKLKSMESGDNCPNHHHQSLHFFCTPKVKFGGVENLVLCGYNTITSNLLWCHQTSLCLFTTLQILKIEDCNNISNLFSSSMAENLINLKRLDVCECQGIEQVIADMTATHESYKLFPSLKKLSLNNLSRLKTFCEWRCALELPLLEDILIDRCQEMASFTCGSLNTPSLKQIQIENKHYGAEELNEMGNLNDLLCRN